MKPYFYYCSEGYKTRTSLSNKIGTNLFFSITNIPIKNDMKRLYFRVFDYDKDAKKLKYLYKLSVTKL